MNQLSRNVHLWIEYFNRTQDALCPPLDLGQIGTVEFERIICQADALERIWSDQSILQAVPRFRRSPTYTPGTGHGTPVGIMGEYIILERYYSRENQYTYTWVSIHDWDGSVAFSHSISPILLDKPVRCCMDPNTNTFYVVLVRGARLL